MTPSHGPRFLFAGTPEFAAVPLRALLEAGYRPLAVLSQPDRPAGRGRKLQASPVKQLALEAGIDVLQPDRLRGDAAHRALSDLQPDLLIVVAYGLILPRTVLDIPRSGCWNIHASLLPRWRGAAPIQRAIEAGDTKTGICIMQMDEGLDTGPVLQRAEMPLSGTETAGELHDRLAALGASTLLDCMEKLESGDLPPAVAQATEGVTYARKLDKTEAQIDWSHPAAVLERRVRAFNPWPVAWCEIAGARIRIWKSRVADCAPDSRPGDVLAAGPQGIIVATSDQALELLELQPAGKKRMSAADFLNSRQLPASLAPRA
jgi:methionyl-tRNA formyltransferase